MLELTGKNIIVTGAASGIGRATAILLSRLGANLILFDLNDDGLKNTNEMIKSETGRECFLYNFDLTDFEKLEYTFSNEKSNFGKLHGLVHCAGIPSMIPLRALTNEDYERVHKINALTGLNLAKLFSKRGTFDSNATCSMVFIASVYALVGTTANIAYAMSKAAVIGMTRALAVELAPKKIRVNCVIPGFVKTDLAKDMMPVGDEEYHARIEKMHLLGWGEPIDIANGIAFLLSDEAKWITGTNLIIDGGFTAQ